jgi:FkbM family methyltransferase
MKKDFVFFYHLIIKKVPDRWLVKFSNTKLGTLFIKFLKSQKKPVDIGNGLKMYFDYTNPRLSHIVYDDDIEEGKSKQAFLDLIDDGDIVIDVGANIGEYSLIAAQKVKEHGKVISIEPLKETAQTLTKHFQLNNFTNYEVITKVIGNETKKVNLYKQMAGGTMGFVDSTLIGRKFEKVDEVEMTTIDEILSTRNIENVKIMKIDIEGYEFELLKGAKNSLQNKKIENMMIEVHINYLKEKGISEKQFYDYLTKQGYVVDTIQKTSSNRSHVHVHI